MADTPSVSETLGLPAEVKHGKDVYKLGPPNQLAKAYLEKSLAANAVKAVAELQDVLPAKEYKAMFDAVVAKVAGRGYATGSQGWFEQLSGVDGTWSFILSLFRVNHPDMTLEQAKTIGKESEADLAVAMAHVVPDFFALALPDLPPEAKAIMTEAFRTAFQSKM